mmetsp:Transcript_8684/g.11283  ORF Transcript_8684/g.11283 Transcript_8684/m.11283 type:complete len:757 (-) Transcript_8684:284-2554(-)
MTEIYSGNSNEVCAFCEDSTVSAFGLGRNRNITIDRLLSALKLVMKSQRSKTVNAASMLKVLENDQQFRLNSSDPEVISVVEHAIASAWPSSKPVGRKNSIPTSENLLKFLETYHLSAMDKILPGNVCALRSLSFLPRPEVAKTRFIGSWIAPCMACAVMMVANFANYLTGPTERNPPTYSVYNLDDGMSADEKMGYELGQQGIPSSVGDRSFIRYSKSRDSCVVCKQAQFLSCSKSLFYGDEQIFLRPVVGNVCGIPIWSSKVEPVRIKKLVQAARNRRTPLVLDEDVLFVQPSLPAADLPIVGLSLLDSRMISTLSTLPLVKCKQEEAQLWPSSVRGIASGKRSAIVFANGIAFRLKGCGNLEQGFLLEMNGDHGEFSLRGCMFGHTVQREIYMTRKVKEGLVNVGIRHIDCANVPLGLYQYDDSSCLKYDKKYKGLPRPFCGIFKTVGDRRLGDHLLSGIEQIMPLFYCNNLYTDKKWIQKTKAKLEAIRGKLWDTATLTECGMDVYDLSEIGIVETSLPSIEESLATVHVPDSYLEVWNRTYLELQDLLSQHSVKRQGCSVLLWLAKIIGEECGLVCHAMTKQELCWGTYPDATGIHCNAHVNNFVVRAKREPNESFLCPLDFDMAYEKSEFLSELVDCQHQGIFPSNFEDIITWEHKLGMRPSLAGSNFTSSGVSNTEKAVWQFKGAESEIMEDLSRIVKIAFRDTMVNNFDEVLESGLSEVSLSKYDSSLSRISDCIVRLALIATSSVVC